MKVKILVEFDVPETDDENIAKSAASMAAHNFLAIDGGEYAEACTVHVDGHSEDETGEYLVRLGDDHE